MPWQIVDNQNPAPRTVAAAVALAHATGPAYSGLSARSLQRQLDGGSELHWRDDGGMGLVFRLGDVHRLNHAAVGAGPFDAIAEAKSMLERIRFFMDAHAVRSLSVKVLVGRGVYEPAAEELYLSVPDIAKELVGDQIETRNSGTPDEHDWWTFNRQSPAGDAAYTGRDDGVAKRAAMIERVEFIKTAPIPDPVERRALPGGPR